jgi:hypothetical protein
MDNPELPWNYYCLYANPNIDISFIISHMYFRSELNIHLYNKLYDYPIDTNLSESYIRYFKNNRIQYNLLCQNQLAYTLYIYRLRITKLIQCDPIIFNLINQLI